MARQFKFEISDVNGNTELYIHDDNSFEPKIAPAIIKEDCINCELLFIDHIINYCRKFKVTKVEVTKVP